MSSPVAASQLAAGAFFFAAKMATQGFQLVAFCLSTFEVVKGIKNSGGEGVPK